MPSTLKVLAVTWNLYGTIPPEEQLGKLFREEVFREEPDVVFIGTQEC